MKKMFILLIFQVSLFSLIAKDFVWKHRQPQKVVCSSAESDVVKTALEIYSNDYMAVFESKVVLNEKSGNILIGTLGNNSKAEKYLDDNKIKLLSETKEGFIVSVNNGTLVVLGSDKRGTAYGILELSRIIGVSPWEWWADSNPPKKDRISIPDKFYTFQSPSVEYRGIFINDEDWGMMPWSSLNYEKTDVKGRIGPKTHAKIFELLLRLRANTFWPAMHDCSEAFYLTPGNKEMADKYGIIIGTSHCEPMLRNTNAEWRIAGEGEYDYVNNRDNVVEFWEERVRDVAGSDGIYTLGIRGVHDGRMQGAKTIKEQKNAISDIFVDQRNLIKKYVSKDVESVPQVFIPYKEVLDVYHSGLEVPEDVTLMWTDDNYGYIRHFPNEIERNRSGGNGIYYHISYWGRPHDYLWLSTTHPALIYTQMKLAYDKGAKKMWIVNVGDLKPAEYNTELFLDIAWNINSIDNNYNGLQNHLCNWLKREFGEEVAPQLMPMINEYYRLAYIRKPEFMGNTRTEEKDPIYKELKDLPWSEYEIRQRIEDYNLIVNQIDKLAANIPEEKKSSWFQLIEYPVKAAAEMSYKHLYAQLARHGKGEWTKSDEALYNIIALTDKYNSIENGKWNLMMDYQPRKLAVYGQVPRIESIEPLLQKKNPSQLINGAGYYDYNNGEPIAHGLGYESKAADIPKGGSAFYSFNIENTDSVWIEVALVPNLPVGGKDIRFSISLNDSEPMIVDFKTIGRSEEWKNNVLTNQAIRIIKHKIEAAGEQKIIIKALDENVIVDQIKIWKDEPLSDRK